MKVEQILTEARVAAGLSRDALATAAGTTLSAYEQARKSPTLATAARIVGEAGFDLVPQPRIEFVERPGDRGRAILVPAALPRLQVETALATVELPCT